MLTLPIARDTVQGVMSGFVGVTRSEGGLAEAAAMGFGMNLGRLAPGGSVRVAYTAGATEAVTDVATLRPSGTVSSREEPEPIAANAARGIRIRRMTGYGMSPGGRIGCYAVLRLFLSCN